MAVEDELAREDDLDDEPAANPLAADLRHAEAALRNVGTMIDGALRNIERVRADRGERGHGLT